MKDKGIVFKIIILLIYIGVISIFAFNKKDNAVDRNAATINQINSIQGNWVINEKDLTLKLDITFKEMKMSFYPNNKQLVFNYEIEGQTIDFYNITEAEDFQWKILKLTSDSLIVLEKELILIFTKE